MQGIIQNVFDALILIVFFGFTIFVHECGHFITALRNGMVVDVFSIGFGPAIWSRKIKGVVYKICIIPLGGYVVLPQLDPTGMEMVQGGDGDKEKETSGSNQNRRNMLPEVSFPRKVFVAAAGSFSNVVFGVVLALIIYLSPNAITGENRPLIVDVDAESPALLAGLRPGDEILAVNGKKVNTWYDYTVECFLGANESEQIELVVKTDGRRRELILNTVKDDNGAIDIPGLREQLTSCRFGWIVPGSSAEKAGLKAGDEVVEFDNVPVVTWTQFIGLVSVCRDKEASIIVRRDGDYETFKVIPVYSSETGRAMIGVGLADRAVPWMQYKNPMKQIKSDTIMIVRFLKALVTPRESRRAMKGVGGPVAIVLTLWISIKSSLFNAVGFLRLLNINLAIINLLPIPLLDGGHIVFCAWERITRRKLNPRIVNGLIKVFGSLLIGLFIIITINDIIKLPRFLGLGKAKAVAEQTEQFQDKE